MSHLVEDVVAALASLCTGCERRYSGSGHEDEFIHDVHIGRIASGRVHSDGSNVYELNEPLSGSTVSPIMTADDRLMDAANAYCRWYDDEHTVTAHMKDSDGMSALCANLGYHATRLHVYSEDAYAVLKCVNANAHVWCSVTRAKGVYVHIRPPNGSTRVLLIGHV